MKNIFITSLVVLLFTGIKCKKTSSSNGIIVSFTCDSANTAFIPTDAKSRFYFNKGSWWVYKNIVNSQLDTVKVIQSDIYIEKPTPEIWGNIPNKCYEKNIVMFQPQKYFRYSTRIEYFYPTSKMDSTKEIYTIGDSYMFDNSGRSSNKMRYYGSILTAGQDSGSVTTYDTISVGKIMYRNVIKYNTSDMSDYASEIFYAPYYGIIQMTRLDGSTWVLINSNIEK
jgi:hypothetical protein